jgi:hypothetical protein
VSSSGGWRPAAGRIPGAIVRDQEEESRLLAANVHEHRLRFEVDVFTTNVPLLRDLIGLILEAVGQDRRWSQASLPLALNTEPLRDSLITAQEEHFLAGARVEFIVVYRTPVFRPSTSHP